VFINNAGFGDAGYFEETMLSKEINMIYLNVRALHIMMKRALLMFEEKKEGYILNIGSSAGLFPAGPFMATYYATKSYVVSLSLAVAEELKQKKSNIYVGVLCPGPVDTEFNNVAEVEFSLNGITPQYCAKYAVKQMFKRKVCIIPTFTMKSAVFFSKFLSRRTLIKATGHQQKKKIYK
jgi:short-subunit dehydrogenase